MSDWGQTPTFGDVGSMSGPPESRHDGAIYEYTPQRAARHAPLKRDDFSSNRHPALAYCWSVIFSEKPVPTFPGHALQRQQEREELRLVQPVELTECLCGRCRLAIMRQDRIRDIGGAG